ncbi:MAG: metal-sensing transcriptional repressor [Leptolyngbyaceae cyanobacterium bins.59]|nr:metal-sensing transcriptional repressor [Leptolyngbyaceae cyanobacterium bins.59]
MTISRSLRGGSGSSQSGEEKATPTSHSHSHENSHGHDHSHRSKHHPHVHSEESVRRIVNRLSRVEGHIRGIKSMVQRDEDCPDVLIQIAAVRGALDRIARMILDEHLTQCIVRASADGNIETELEELKIALDRFLPRDKPANRKQTASTEEDF